MCGVPSELLSVLHALAVLRNPDMQHRRVLINVTVKEQDNVWSRLAFTELFKVLEERQKSVAAFVRSAGATTRDDRTGLTQLVMSLDRAFIKVELALANT